MSNSLEEDLAFALESNDSGALTYEEFHIWVERVIAAEDNLPTYLFELYDAKSMVEVEKIVRERLRYTPDSRLSLQESEALWGIAAKRGHTLESFEGLTNTKSALGKLAEYPAVVDRFQKTFPFINLKI